jgi:hypothetical protein
MKEVSMITPQILAEILALSAVVVPITQAIKNWLDAKGTKALIISIIISILLSLWRVLSVEPYDWAKFVILVVGVFLESNGIYKFGAYAIGKKT